jgi:PucR family transcriptional regulator, purine catabolism regulatory protein
MLGAVVSVRDVIDRMELAGFQPRQLGQAVGGEREVFGVRFVVDLVDVERAARGDVVVVGGGGIDLAGYELDVAIRRTAAAGSPALVIATDPHQRLSTTALRLAERDQTAIIGVSPDESITDVLLQIGSTLAGGLVDLVARSRLLLDRLSLDGHDMDADSILAVVAAAIGELPRTTGDATGVPVLLHDPDSPRIAFTSSSSDTENTVRELLLWRVAAAATSQLIRSEQRLTTSWSSKIETLAELIDTDDETQLRRLGRRARALGVPVDGHHLIVRLDLLNLWELGGDEGLAGFEIRGLVEDRMQSLGELADGCWPLGRAGDVLIVLLSWIDSPGSAAARTVMGATTSLIGELVQLLPGLRLRCGVSGVHQGIRGIGASLEEGRVAVLKASATEVFNRPVTSDVLGLRPVMLEWFASTQVRSALGNILEPLGSIDDPLLRTRLLETLTVYLDMGCSAAKAGAVLGLHRNGIAYRLRQIERTLRVDLDNPDDRLALHLACRARALF